MALIPISVLVPIKNEALNLPRCLAGITWADEVWIIDSNSTDDSQKIAHAEDARRKNSNEGRVYVAQFHFEGTWPKKKNWALENIPFKHEWVLILDADEELQPESESEIRQIVTASNLISTSAEDIVGYWINRRFMFMGKWLKHSYYPNWNMRLFKHRLGRYEKLTDVDTASGDNEVHEHVIVRGRSDRLRCEMDHYSFPSVEVFVEKHNRYSNWEARVAADRFLKGSAGQLQAREVGLRRKLKRWSHTLPFRPFLRFCYVYIWQRGFLDGREGYYFARLHATYELLCIAKEFELRQMAIRRQSLMSPQARGIFRS